MRSNSSLGHRVAPVGQAHREVEDGHEEHERAGHEQRGALNETDREVGREPCINVMNGDADAQRRQRPTPAIGAWADGTHRLSRPHCVSGTRDHQALDLVRALVDLRDLRVAHHPLDRVLVHVAVAAEHLDGLDRDRHRGVGGEQLGHRRCTCRGRARRGRPSRTPCRAARARRRCASPCRRA